MIKFVIFSALMCLVACAPAPGFLHGGYAIPAATSYASRVDVVHSAPIVKTYATPIIAKTVVAAPAISYASPVISSHGIGLGGHGYGLGGHSYGFGGHGYGLEGHSYGIGGHGYGLGGGYGLGLGHGYGGLSYGYGHGHGW